MTNKSKWVWAICVKGGSVGGCFEDYSLRGVVKQMVKCCLEANEYPGEIIRIFATTNKDKEISLKSRVVDKVNNAVSRCVDGELFDRHRMALDIESELRREYYASVL